MACMYWLHNTKEKQSKLHVMQVYNKSSQSSFAYYQCRLRLYFLWERAGKALCFQSVFENTKVIILKNILFICYYIKIIFFIF